MRISPVGLMIVTVCALAGIAIWIVGYFGLPNADTHRNLAQNPPIQSSVNQTSGGTSSTTGGTQTGGGQATSTPWYALDKAAKTVDFTLTAGSPVSGDQGFNFNGFSKGALKIVVPQGWKVNVTFKNADANIPHSLGMVPYAQRNASAFTPAFAGSVSPNFQSGITASGGDLKFSFTAQKVGQYVMVCGVPGHDVAGMWDEFDISSSAKSPTVTTPTGTVTVK